MTHEEVAERVKQLIAGYAEYHIAQESIDELVVSQKIYLDGLRRGLEKLGYCLAKDAAGSEVLALVERTVTRWEAHLWAFDDDSDV